MLKKDMATELCALRAKCSQQETDIANLRAQLQELRTTHTQVRNARTLETIRDRMAAAKAEALRTGRCVKVAA